MLSTVSLWITCHILFILLLYQHFWEKWTNNGEEPSSFFRRNAQRVSKTAKIDATAVGWGAWRTSKHCERMGTGRLSSCNERDDSGNSETFTSEWRRDTTVIWCELDDGYSTLECSTPTQSLLYWSRWDIAAASLNSLKCAKHITSSLVCVKRFMWNWQNPDGHWVRLSLLRELFCRLLD